MTCRLVQTLYSCDATSCSTEKIIEHRDTHLPRLPAGWWKIPDYDVHFCPNCAEQARWEYEKEKQL